MLVSDRAGSVRLAGQNLCLIEDLMSLLEAAGILGGDMDLFGFNAPVCGGNMVRQQRLLLLPPIETTVKDDDRRIGNACYAVSSLCLHVTCVRVKRRQKAMSIRASTKVHNTLDEITHSQSARL